MAKRVVVPVGVLVAILAVGEFLPGLLWRPSPADLERDSDRIGWTAAIESRDLAYDIFLRVNDERTARGLAPLVWHEGLAGLAGRWSEEMISTGYRHSTEDFRAHPDFAGSAENIFMGPEDAAAAHVGWMESDGHRDNLLSPDVTAVGIGVVCRHDGRMWATQIFGVPHGARQLQTPQTPVAPIVRDDAGPACPRPSWPFVSSAP
jgi:hypothetical protein